MRGGSSTPRGPREGAGPGRVPPRGRGRRRRQRRLATKAARQTGPRVGGNKEANAGAGRAGARLSADGLSKRGEAWGPCRREAREGRAGDVSAPCPLRHLAPPPRPLPPLLHIDSSPTRPPAPPPAPARGGGRPGPRRGLAALGGPPRPRAPSGRDARAAPLRPLPVRLVPASSRTKHACARTSGRALAASAASAGAAGPRCWPTGAAVAAAPL